MDRNGAGSWRLAMNLVALRKESVDRNTGLGVGLYLTTVALRKESVDRNSVFDFLDLSDVCRSPQGERG